MKKNKKQKFIRITAIILALLMVVPMLISAFATVAYGADITYVDDSGKKYTLTDFRDTQGHWAQAQIRAWADYKIINGYNGEFMPNNAITRCDIACIIDRLLNLSYTSYNSFRDLQSGQYYTDSMLKCYASGYIKGDEKNLRPLDTATREEVATILFRVFNMEEETSRSNFTDAGSISSWASSEVATMASKGFIKGYPDGSFGPQNNITRAELITMLDNIISVYITSNIKSSDNITLNADGNVINTKKGMTISRSTLNEDLYCTQSCTNLTLIDTTIDGTAYLLADRIALKLTNSSVASIYTNAVADIKGAGSIELLHVSYEGSGTIIDDMPEKIILEPNASIMIGKAVYVNESNKAKEYDSEEIYKDLAKDGYKLTHSPSINLSDLKISADNIVSYSSLRPGQTGNGELKSFGILMMEGTSIPNIDDYDDKLSYRASYLDDYYADHGGTRGTISDEIGTQEEGTTYTYVPYALNYGGMIVYGEPIVLKAYDFEYNMTLLDPGDYPNSVKVILTFEGSNIPRISGVTLYYDTTPAYVAERNQKNMSLMRITDTDTRYQEDKVGERVLYSCSLSTVKNKVTGEYEMPTYFGYQIKFGDGSVYSEFPFLMNAVPDSLSPISSIETGYATVSNSNLTIADNKIETLNTIVNQYGIVYSYTDEGAVASSNFFDDSWDFMPDGNSISLNSEQTYDVSLNIEDGKDIHYAAYVRTVEGYYFGGVKTYNAEDEGSGDIKTSMSMLKMVDGNLLLVVNSELSFPDVASSKIVYAKDSSGNEIPSLKNSSFSNHLVYYGGNRVQGSRFFIELPGNLDITTLKVQCYGEVKTTAYECSFEDITHFEPYLLFSSESDGLYHYNLVLPDVPDIISSVDVAGLPVSVSFDNETFVLSSSQDLSTYNGDYLLTVSLNSIGGKHNHTYVCKMAVN